MSDDGIDKIVKYSLPVLCLDTCTVLDLLRFPKRNKINVWERRVALQLLIATENRNRLAILLADQVSFELQNLLNKIEEETKRTIEDLKQKIADVEDMASVYGELGTTDLDHLDGYVSLARAIVDRYTNVATPINKSEDVAGRALVRLNKATTPARKGEDAIKDCVIIETYLELAHRLRESGHEKPIVFASSDVKDYAQNCGTVLKPDLGAEFDVFNMEYAPNLVTAKDQLGL